LSTVVCPGRPTFWDMYDPDNVIAMHLHDEFYATLVIEVDDPAGVAAEIAPTSLVIHTEGLDRIRALTARPVAGWRS
jgi:hypothetical protein